MSDMKRPLGITLLALLLALNGISLIASLFFPSMLGDEAWLLWAFVAMGFGYIVAAVGLFMGFNWSWYLTLGLSFIAIAISITYLDVLDLIFDGIVIFYVTRPNARSFLLKKRTHSTIILSGSGAGGNVPPPPPPPPP
jgi:hypothetical protein